MRVSARYLRAVLVLSLISVALLIGAARAGEVRTGLSAQSPALNGAMTYSLYLPGAYGENPSRRFPVVYLLHGYGASDREWLELGQLDVALDRMIREKTIPPVIAVMPYGARSWYVDSAALGGPGDYETAIMRDLIGHVERSYRTITERRGRLIAGLSMGGYGALRMAFFHPDRFGAVASLSGALYETVGIPGVDKPVEQAQEEAEHWYRGAYGQPFDAAIYKARSPFSRVAALSRMQDPPKVLIMSGDDDYFRFYEGSAALFESLRGAGVPSELRIEDGGHDWDLWRRQIPAIMRFLTRDLRNGNGTREITPQ